MTWKNNKRGKQAGMVFFRAVIQKGGLTKRERPDLRDTLIFNTGKRCFKISIWIPTYSLQVLCDTTYATRLLYD
jgi:hypothetical protein